MKKYFAGVLMSLLLLVDVVINVIVSILGVKDPFMRGIRKLFGDKAQKITVQPFNAEEGNWRDKLIRDQEAELDKIKLTVRNHLLGEDNKKVLFDMCK